jgi:hypothetical protein
MKTSVSVLAVVLTCVGLAGLGCSTVSSMPPRPKAEQMPINSRWEGLYQGPYHVSLNIRTQGNRATGTWRAIGDRQGEFHGTISGNLLVLDFTERTRKGDMAAGRGYFVYRVDKAARAHEIYGEWGIGVRGARSSWWAVKRSDKALTPEQSAKLLDGTDSGEDERGGGAGGVDCGLLCEADDTAAE